MTADRIVAAAGSVVFVSALATLSIIAAIDHVERHRGRHRKDD